MNTQAAAKLSSMTTLQLVELFEATESRNDPEIPAVRGWLMDALELRNQQAFDEWMGSVPTEPSPRGFFL